jgi:type IV pilus assembly protein PilA
LSTAQLHTRLAADERGFSLIELLVVCLVIAILCAIAIPQFLSQSGKARDASAKELTHHAQIAAETIANENDGSYQDVTPEELNATEPAIPIEASESHAYIGTTTHTRDSYSITAVATDGDELTLARDATGQITRTCHSAHGGCSEGETGSW